MLPNYLSNIKSSGFYRFVFDKSDMPGQVEQTLRLVVGYSEKGPFNTPIYVEDQATFQQIFGGRSKKLERYGMWFHRLALEALKAGPILALNLKNFKRENESDNTVNSVDYTTFNPNQTAFNTDEEAKICANLTMTVNQLYNTDRFWTLEPEHLEDLEIEGILPANKDLGYITITNTDTKENSCTIFMRGYEPKGFDVPFAEWYSAVLNGEEVPSYLEGHERDLVSQYFAEIFIFKGEFTPEIAASEKLAKFFNVEGDKVTLKPYILNAFGEKIDTLSALAQNDASNFVRSYNGILLPEFRDANNVVISLDALVNGDNYIHKLMMRLNQDMLYNITEDSDFQISDIDTTGWNVGPDNIEGYQPMCLTQVDPVIYTGTFEDGEWKYEANEGHEGEAADFYLYDGLEPMIPDAESEEALPDEYTLVFNDEDNRFGATGIRQGDSLYVGEVAHVVNISETPKETTKEYWTLDGETYYEDPTYEESNSYEIIDSEDSWNASYANGVLKEYYEKNPSEDLEKQGGGEVSFNDRIWIGTIDDVDVQFKAGWEENSQSITNVNDPNEKYYIARINPSTGAQYFDYEFIGNSWPLYSDTNLTTPVYEDPEAEEPVVKMFDITNLTFDGCTHTYNAWVANGADPINNPWICPNFISEDVNSKLIFKYEDMEDQMPWGDVIFGNGEGHKAWGIVAAKVDLGIIDFDKTKLEMVLEHQGVEQHEELITYTQYTVQLDKPNVDTSKIYKCMGSMTATSAYLKPLYLKGYVYENAKPESTKQWDKLEWQHYMLDTLTEYKGLREALTNRVDVNYRYLVDTFEGFVEGDCKARLAAICKAKDNTFGILNFPSMKSFSKCPYTSFRNEKGEFDTKYIPQGGNSLKPMAQLFTLPSQEDGASWVGFFTSLNVRDVNTGIKETIPSAALVSNNFMLKYSKYFPYTIIAGTNRGVISEAGLQGPDFNFSRYDLDNLEPFGVNCMVYVDNKGTVINSNQTAKQNPVTALSKIHVRELCIFLQDEIEKMLEDYHWDFNTPALRDRIKERADVILETCKNNQGVYTYYNQCNSENNTPEVIDNEFLILSTSIEPTRGAGKMVQTLTIYRTGGLSAAIAEA